MKAIVLILVAAILMLISWLSVFRTKKFVAYYVDYFERSQYRPKYLAKYHSVFKERTIKVLKSDMTLVSCKASGVGSFVMAMILLYVVYLEYVNP